MRWVSLLGVFFLGCTFFFSGGGSSRNGDLGYNPNIVGEYEPWGSSGRPKTGPYPKPAEIASDFIAPSKWKKAVYEFKVSPHDPWSPNPGKTFVKNTQLVDVFLDRDSLAERVIIVETHSGEYFLVAFAPADDENSWLYLKTYSLPAMARDSKCRASGDGLYRSQGANVIKFAPQFLWIEMQISDTCSKIQYTQRSLHLYALIGSRFESILEVPVTREQFFSNGIKVGEQISYEIKLDERKGGLLLTGPREVYPAAGGDTPEIYPTDLWHYFDGHVYRSREGKLY